MVNNLLLVEINNFRGLFYPHKQSKLASIKILTKLANYESNLENN